MKKWIALFLSLSLCLSGCGLIPPKSTLPPETEAPTSAVTEPETEAPTEPPVYYNPLTGVQMHEPQKKRIYAVSISNIPDAMPRVGVCLADIYMEMYVNDSIVRGLALYTDPSIAQQIGPVRSTRYMFNDLATHYDLIVAHAGGNQYTLANAKERGVESFNIDTWDSTYYSFRDKDRTLNHYGWEHVLFARGEGLEQKAEEEGFRTTIDPDLDYRLRFQPDGTPEDGETAERIDLVLTYHASKKDCGFVYDDTVGRYAYWQYGKEMHDGLTDEVETYDNVIVIFPTHIQANWLGCQEANLEDGGDGYYASGGKIIPIKWGCDDEHSPFWFTTEDGEQLVMTQGRTFIAITEVGSPMTWGENTPAEQ